METIVEITDKAQRQIEKIFADKKETSGLGLRLGVIGGGCSGLTYKMDFDSTKDNDNIFSVSSFHVYIDPKSSIYLEGVTLDYQDGLEGKGFVFKNPNASNTCGCGESFTV